MTEPRSRRLPLFTGLSYHLLEWGGDDPALDHTVVLLHGFLDLACSWEETVASGLAGRYHLVAPDFRGHGDSDRVGAGGYYHFLDYVADLEDVIAQVGRARVSVVGHSMGGAVAGYYAGTFPDRLHRVAILEGLGPPQTTDTGPDRTAVWIRGWRKVAAKTPRTYASVAEAAQRLRQVDPRLDEARALRLAEKGTAPVPGGGRRFKHDPLHATRGPYGFHVDLAMQFWARIRCPVLLVDGGESDFRHPPDEDARRRAAFADARSAVVPGAGHMMMRHRPRELAALLHDFLAP